MSSSSVFPPMSYFCLFSIYFLNFYKSLLAANWRHMLGSKVSNAPSSLLSSIASRQPTICTFMSSWGLPQLNLPVSGFPAPVHPGQSFGTSTSPYLSLGSYLLPFRENSDSALCLRVPSRWPPCPVGIPHSQCTPPRPQFSRSGLPCFSPSGLCLVSMSITSRPMSKLLPPETLFPESFYVSIVLSYKVEHFMVGPGGHNPMWLTYMKTNTGNHFTYNKSWCLFGIYFFERFKSNQLPTQPSVHFCLLFFACSTLSGLNGKC